MAFVKYKHVAFNAEWVKTKSFEEFYEHEKHHGLSKEEMKEAYESITKGSKKKEASK